MQRKSILKQLNSIQKSMNRLEKEHKRGHFEPRKTRKPDRLRDTEEDRKQPIEVPKEVPKKPPYDPFGDLETAGLGKAEGDTAPATESTRRFDEAARRRNEAAEDVKTDPKRFNPTVRKPPYKMEYLDEVELDLQGNEIPIDKDDWETDYRHVGDRKPQHVKSREAAKAEIARGDEKRQGPERVRVPSKPVPEEENFDMMRKAIAKLMQKEDKMDKYRRQLDASLASGDIDAEEHADATGGIDVYQAGKAPPSAAPAASPSAAPVAPGSFFHPETGESLLDNQKDRFHPETGEPNKNYSGGPSAPIENAVEKSLLKLMQYGKL